MQTKAEFTICQKFVDVKKVWFVFDQFTLLKLHPTMHSEHPGCKHRGSGELHGCSPK